MERQARRAQVLRHAKRIFARKGYHRTNVADIIARARIARGTFYLYFQNKKDLFEELLAQVLTELSRRIQRLRPDEPDPVNQLRDNLQARDELRAGGTRIDRHPAQPFDGLRSRPRFTGFWNSTSVSLTPFSARSTWESQMNLVRPLRHAHRGLLHPGRNQGSGRPDSRGGVRVRSIRWSRKFWTSDCAAWRDRSCLKRRRRRGELQAPARLFLAQSRMTCQFT